MKKKTRNVKSSTIEKLVKETLKTNVSLLNQAMPTYIPPPIITQIPSSPPPPPPINQAPPPPPPPPPPINQAPPPPPPPPPPPFLEEIIGNKKELNKAPPPTSFKPKEAQLSSAIKTEGVELKKQLNKVVVNAEKTTVKKSLMSLLPPTEKPIGEISEKPQELLEAIRKGAKLKKTDVVLSAKSKNINLDQGPYKHVSTKPEDPNKNNNTLIEAFNKKMDVKQTDASLLLDGKNKEEQLNILYSAILDKAMQLAEELISHTQLVQVKTGVIDDDWGEEKEETRQMQVFSKEEIKDVEEKVEEAKKRIEQEIRQEVRKEAIINNNILPINNYNPEIDKGKEEINDEIDFAPPPLPPPGDFAPPPLQIDINNTNQKPKWVDKASQPKITELITDNPQDLLKKREHISELDAYSESISIGSNLEVLKRRFATGDDAEEDINEFMTKKDEKGALDVLFNTIIKGEKELMESFLENDPGSENKKFFTKKNCQEVCNAAQKYLDNGIIEKKKVIMIEKCIETLVKEKDLTETKAKNTGIERN